MKYILAIAKIDFADEFYCEAFFAGPEENWSALESKIMTFLSKLESHNREEKLKLPPGDYRRPDVLEISFGTNEYLSFENLIDFTNHVRKFEISENEFEFLRKTFGRDGCPETVIWGTGQNMFDPNYWEAAEEEKEDSQQ